MTSFWGEIDSPAIVMDHCRGTGQKFTMGTVKEDPRETLNGKNTKWKPLNWNHVGHLNGGDTVSFQDTKGTFWCIFISRLPTPDVEIEAAKRAGSVFEEERRKNIAAMKAAVEGE